MNKTETAKVLAVLKAAFRDGAADEATVAAYQMGLDDVPYEAAMAAARELIKTATFFPRVSEIRALLLEKLLGLPSPEEAWGEVMAQVRAVGSYGVPSWSCLALDQAVTALGWRAVCASEEGDAATRAHFFRTYQAYRERSLRAANLPALWGGEEGPPRLVRGEPEYRRSEERGPVPIGQPRKEEPR